MKLRCFSYYSTLFGVWLCTVLPPAYSALGSGTVTNCTQNDLEAALAGGGTVLFACSGTVLLTNTITISADTVIDANGYAVVVSGNSSVRLFLVTGSANFQVNGLTLANGRIVGASGANGDPPFPGENVYGAGILNQGGTLTLLDCTLTNHYVLGGTAGTNSTSGNGYAKGGDALGACIYNDGGVVNLTNCTLAGNAATGGLGTPPSGQIDPGGDGGQALGGAIYSVGATGNLQNVILLNNNVTGGAAQVGHMFQASGGGAAAGGAFYATNSIVLINGSVMESNQATGGSLINTDITSSGRGSGSGKGGGLFLSQGSSANIRLSSFTSNFAIGGGGGRFEASGAALGGAVFNGGQLQISDSSFSSNQSRGGSGGVFPGVGKGGAIYSTNSLVVTGCTLDNNLAVGAVPSAETITTFPGAAGEGGALWSSGVLAVTNSTCNANAAAGGRGGGFGYGAGGAGSGGAVDVTGGTAFLVNVTLAGNRSDGGAYPSNPPGQAQGGAVCNTNGALTARNSIFANSANGGDVWGIITDTGYNICSDGTANFSASGSLNNTDPQLSALGYNGGPTATMALLVGSPARDAIPAGFPATDQRGVSRPQGPAADIGAFEATAISTPPILIATRAGSNLTISFAAQAGVTYKLLSSPDLKVWSAVATNSAQTAGSLQFVQPMSVAPKSFYRVVVQ